jgi:hypothetical protein
MVMPAQIFDILEKLSDERKDVIYRLTLDMLSAQEIECFADYSPEEVKEIEQARKRIADGDCLSFSNAEEVKTHFGVN